jgi:release factor glutamine methyltransferase
MPSSKLFQLDIAWTDDVYRPAADTMVLADGLEAAPGMACLDMCTGCGLAALVLARDAGACVATDVNPEACRVARENALRNDLWLDVACMDLAKAIDAPFDVIAVNPPYLPDEPSSRDPLVERHVAGGPEGLQMPIRALDEVQDLLAPGGDAYMVCSTKQDLDTLEAEAAERGFAWAIDHEQSVGRFETLYRVHLEREEPLEVVEADADDA